MKLSIKSLIAAALAGTALFSALPASAHDWDGDRGERHEWREHNGWHHGRYWGPRYEERVVVRERPVYREYYAPAPVYYSAPRYYYAPPPVRYYQSEPSITLGVDIPIR